MVRKTTITNSYTHVTAGTYETNIYNGTTDFSTSFQYIWTLGGFTQLVLTPMVSIDGTNFTEYVSKAQTELADGSGVFNSHNEAIISYKFKYVLTGSGSFEMTEVIGRMQSR